MEDCYKEEVECVHLYLDELGVPREDSKDTFSLVGRIKELEKRYLKQMSEVEDHYLRRIPYMMGVDPFRDVIGKESTFNCSCGEGSKVVGESYCSQCLKNNPLLCT